ncbi:MAG: primosomal protein N' (replication factor Y) - superfamily II helicase [Rhodobacteraceae bacterium]|nr:primosomal protein N' (replication factor Y) - superfamily II helicase [Paracoccaceae bacterium]
MAEAGEERFYPCDMCGASLRFAPGQTRLACEHCGHVQAIGAGGRADRARALRELDLDAALKGATPDAAMEETRVVRCPSCGAEVVFDPATHARECPFCATPVVTDTGSHRQIKPAAVVPFRLTEREGLEAMTAWLGRLWFAPSGLKDYARKGRKLDGLYVPYWTFDAETATRYSGRRGDAYYVTESYTVTVNGKTQHRTRQVRKIRWTSVSGRVTRAFDDVMVMASTSLPRGYADGLEPWDLGALLPYAPDYLAGFRAEGYTVALADGWQIAREKMDQVIEGDIRRDIGGDEQQILSADTRSWDETFKHVLLPVWLAAFRYRDRSYRVIVNAQTGKVQGERPWSAWKIAFAVVLALAVIAGGVYLYQQYVPR